MKNGQPVKPPKAAFRRRSPRRPYRGDDDSYIRDVTILKERLEGSPTDLIAERHDLSQRQVGRILASPSMKQLHQEWVQERFAKLRTLGDLNFAATKALIENLDSYTVNKFWTRMGVDASLGAEGSIEQLRISASPEVLKLVRDIAGGTTLDEPSDPGTENGKTDG